MINLRLSLAAAAIAGVMSTSAAAAPLSLLPFERPQAPQATAYAPIENEDTAELPSKFKRQVVNYATNEALRAAMKGYTELWITGHRELLQTA